MLEPGKVWIGEYERLASPTITFTISVEGEKVINDTIATVLREEYHNPITDERKVRNYYAVEDDARFYLYSEQKERFNLVWDLNLTVGDTIARHTPHRDYIVRLDTYEEVEGIKRRKLGLSTADTDVVGDWWIEGIGVSYIMAGMSFIEPMRDYLFSDGSWSHIIACYKDGVCLYQEPGYKPTEISEIVDDDAVGERQPVIYDLYGRMVTQPQRGAVYIINGQKTVWQ